MMSQDDIFDPSSSPSLIMKGDPYFADVSSSPDIDPSFLNLLEVSNGDWLHEEPSFPDELSQHESSAGAKQSLASNYYVEDEANLPSPPQPMPIVPDTSQLIQKPVVFQENVCVVAPNSSSLQRQAAVDIPKDEIKRSVYSPNVPLKKEFNTAPSAKQAKRGRPMKITSHSKQALYAREYRRKNKMALWSYEKMVAEQNEEIADLMRQNEEMRQRLASMTKQFAQMKRLIAAYPTIAAKFQDLTGNIQ